MDPNKEEATRECALPSSKSVTRRLSVKRSKRPQRRWRCGCSADCLVYCRGDYCSAGDSRTAVFGASAESAFVNFIYVLSGVFLRRSTVFSPYRLWSVSRSTRRVLLLSLFTLIAWGVAKLFTLNSNHPEAE